jgi:hypothetical protein
VIGRVRVQPPARFDTRPYGVAELPRTSPNRGGTSASEISLPPRRRRRRAWNRQAGRPSRRHRRRAWNGQAQRDRQGDTGAGLESPSREPVKETQAPGLESPKRRAWNRQSAERTPLRTSGPPDPTRQPPAVRARYDGLGHEHRRPGGLRRDAPVFVPADRRPLATSSQDELCSTPCHRAGSGGLSR